MHLPRFALLKLPSKASNKYIFYGVLIGLALSLTTTSVLEYLQERKRKRAELTFEPRPIELRSDEVVDGVTGLIGEWIGIGMAINYVRFALNVLGRQAIRLWSE